jgi:putative transposase
MREYHRRHLPHYYPPESILFLTWRLSGSLPRCAKCQLDPSPGRAFLKKDRLLDRAAEGPRWLSDPRIATLFSEALQRGATEFHRYDLRAWCIMPNHVHLVIQPHRLLPQITRWLKGSTARCANQLLDREGQPFWQDEVYDHCIRTTKELNRIIDYVKQNPVSAGLAETPEAWHWSSAGQAEGLSHKDC